MGSCASKKPKKKPSDPNRVECVEKLQQGQTISGVAFGHLWQSFDVDDSGYLSKEEIREFFKEVYIGNDDEDDDDSVIDSILGGLLRNVDKDRSGKVSYDEFHQWFLSQGYLADATTDENLVLVSQGKTKLSSDEFRNLWAKIDVDSSGYLSKKEIGVFFKHFYFPQEEESDLCANTIKVAVNSMLKTIDTDQGGNISFDELFTYFQSQHLIEDTRDDLSKTHERMNFLTPLFSKKKITHRQFYTIWSHYDKNKNGSLDLEELGSFFRDLYEALGLVWDDVDHDSFNKGLMDLVDLNHNGRVEKTEFESFFDNSDLLDMTDKADEEHM